MSIVEAPPVPAEVDAVALTLLIDTFLTTACARNLVPVGEVEDFALDLRRIVNPVVAPIEAPADA